MQISAFPLVALKFEEMKVQLLLHRFSIDSRSWKFENQVK